MSADRLTRLDLPEYFLNCVLGTFDPNIVFSPTRNQIKDIASPVLLSVGEMMTIKLHQQQEAVLLKEVKCEEIYRAILFSSIVAEGLQEGFFFNPELKTRSYRYTLRNVMANVSSQINQFYEINDLRRKLGHKVFLKIPVTVNNMPWQLEGSYFVRHSGIGSTTSISAIPMKVSEK